MRDIEKLGEMLYSMFPALYRREDAAQEPEFPLKRYFQILGTGFDFMKDKITGMEDMYNLDNTPAVFLPYLYHQLGFDFPYFLTETEQRSLLKVVPMLYDNKGSSRVFEFLARNMFGNDMQIDAKLRPRNLLPGFAYWTLHANATVEGAYELSLDADASFNESSVVVACQSEREYTFIGFRTARWVIQELDDSDSVVSTPHNDSTGNVSGDLSVTFTTTSSTTKIKVVATNVDAGLYVFENPMLAAKSAVETFYPKTNERDIDLTVFVGGSTNDLTRRSNNFNILADRFRPVNTQLNVIVSQPAFTDVFGVVKTDSFFSDLITDVPIEETYTNPKGEEYGTEILGITDTDVNAAAKSDETTDTLILSPETDTRSRASFSDGHTDVLTRFNTVGHGVIGKMRTGKRNVVTIL
jgi:hypothetical protein